MDHGHGFRLGSAVVLPAMFAVKEEAELAGREITAITDPFWNLAVPVLG